MLHSQGVIAILLVGLLAATKSSSAQPLLFAEQGFKKNEEKNEVPFEVLGKIGPDRAMPFEGIEDPRSKEKIDLLKLEPLGPDPFTKEKIEKLNPLGPSAGKPFGSGAKGQLVDLRLPSVFTALAASEPTETVAGNIESYQSGYAELGEACATAERGTEVTLFFNVEVEAVTTRDIVDHSRSFANSLNQSERHSYDKTEQSYQGGLNIPFLEFFGLNLGAKYDKESIREKRGSTSNYDERLKEVTDMMKTNTNQRLKIHGSMKAVGYSRFPTTSCAYIKIAHVTYKDGTKQTIVSSDNQDLKTRDRKTSQDTPSTSKESNISW